MPYAEAILHILLWFHHFGSSHNIGYHLLRARYQFLAPVHGIYTVLPYLPEPIAQALFLRDNGFDHAVPSLGWKSRQIVVAQVLTRATLTSLIAFALSSQCLQCKQHQQLRGCSQNWSCVQWRRGRAPICSDISSEFLMIEKPCSDFTHLGRE